VLHKKYQDYLADTCWQFSSKLFTVLYCSSFVYRI